MVSPGIQQHDQMTMCCKWLICEFCLKRPQGHPKRGWSTIDSPWFAKSPARIFRVLGAWKTLGWPETSVKDAIRGLRRRTRERVLLYSKGLAREKNETLRLEVVFRRTMKHGNWMSWVHEVVVRCYGLYIQLLRGAVPLFLWLWGAVTGSIMVMLWVTGPWTVLNSVLAPSRDARSP